MVKTVKHLMNCGFRVLYGYTQSDEISLLFHPNEETFQRKLRKYNSVLAGEASAKFSLLIGDIGTFDCRICQLPQKELVVDYFRWRNEDAHRNALNAHCYWSLRKEGISAQKAAIYLSKKSIAEKNEMLFQKGINFNNIPNWQKQCTVAILIDIDPIDLVRRKKRQNYSMALEQYVNDRPYVCSSFMSIALSRVFGQTLNGIGMKFNFSKFFAPIWD